METNEDIAVKPFYHADDFRELPNPSNTKATQWKICQSIFVADVKKSNLNAIDVIERGAESINFIIPSEDVSIEDLIKDIESDTVLIQFELLFLSEEFINSLNKLLPNAKINYALGSDIASGWPTLKPIPSRVLKVDGKTGLKGEYFDKNNFEENPIPVNDLNISKFGIETFSFKIKN